MKITLEKLKNGWLLVHQQYGTVVAKTYHEDVGTALETIGDLIEE